MATVYVTNEKGNLVKRLAGFNEAARHAPWLVVVDLNGTNCAPDLLAEILPAPAPLMTCRIAVRAIEAWLMGDRDRLASFLGIAASRLPIDPDGVANPKQTLVNAAAGSRRRAIREDMTPRTGSGRSVGPNYVGRLIEFMTDEAAGWRPEVAANRSVSLARALRALSP